ncbi:hypothetical protein C8J56DRAFT_1068511 [Mycena floridula]|nr:hypothetical protein C8J56DRAFT_1068511 [Mycena floridula]
MNWGTTGENQPGMERALKDLYTSKPQSPAMSQLPSALSRLVKSGERVPGVNTPSRLRDVASDVCLARRGHGVPKWYARLFPTVYNAPSFFVTNPSWFRRLSSRNPIRRIHHLTCADRANFAPKSWIELDVDQLLADRAADAMRITPVLKALKPLPPPPPQAFWTISTAIAANERSRRGEAWALQSGVSFDIDLDPKRKVIIFSTVFSTVMDPYRRSLKDSFPLRRIGTGSKTDNLDTIGRYGLGAIPLFQKNKEHLLIHLPPRRASHGQH